MIKLIRKIFKNKKKLFFYIIGGLLLYFVLLDEAADTFLTSVSSKILSDEHKPYESRIVYLLLGLQIIFSPLQAGFSDFYLRKKSIIVSLSATLLSVILLKISTNYGIFFLVCAVILKGVLGNTLPIAWAGLAENTRGRNIRFALALSICFLAIGSWGSLLVLPYLAAELFFWLVVILLAIGLGSAIYPFKDPEDAPKPHFLETISPIQMLVNECTGIYHISKKPLNFFTLLSFLFSEISFYQILFRVEVFNNYHCFIRVPLAIGIGYTVGTIALKFIKAKDRFVSLSGLALSITAILIVNILFSTGHENQFMFTTLFACYSFGYALFTPSLFSLITPREHAHLQGKIYGILESTDSLASLITFLIVFLTQRLTCNLVVAISTATILISAFFFYFVFKRAPKDH